LELDDDLPELAPLFRDPDLLDAVMFVCVPELVERDDVLVFLAQLIEVLGFEFVLATMGAPE